MFRHRSRAFMVLGAVSLAGPAVAHDGAHATNSKPPTDLTGYAFPIPEPGSYRLPPIHEAAGGSVLTSEGRAVDLAKLLRDRITVFSFIYTRCADICPVATMQLSEVRDLARGIPKLGGKLNFVSMSFDPEHDTPPVVAEYGDLWRERDDGGAEWLFVTAPDQAALDPILTAYNQAVAPELDPENPTGSLNHILRVFLIDETGMVRNIYSIDFLNPQLVLADIQTLMNDTISP